MKKGYRETMLQLLLSPIHIFISDNYQVRSYTYLMGCTANYGSTECCHCLGLDFICRKLQQKKIT